MILPGRPHRQREFQPRQRAAGGGRRLGGEIGERLEIAVAAAQPVAETGGRTGVSRLQVDDVIALDHAEPRAAVFKTDDLHELVPA